MMYFHISYSSLIVIFIVIRFSKSQPMLDGENFNLNNNPILPINSFGGGGLFSPSFGSQILMPSKIFSRSGSFGQQQTSQDYFMNRHLQQKFVLPFRKD